MNIEQERAAFEAWITASPYEKPVNLNPDSSGFPGQYRSYEVQLAWEAYKAGRAAIEADRQRRGEPVAWIRKNGFRFLAEIEPQDDSEMPLYANPQQVVPLSDERIRIIWKETKARMGCGGDPVLWFARAIERAHGISAPQPAEPVKDRAEAES